MSYTQPVNNGTEFNKLHEGKKFIKLTYDTEIDDDLLLYDGLNTTMESITFCDIENVDEKLNYDHWYVRNVEIPDDAWVGPCWFEKNMWETNKLVLSPRVKLCESKEVYDVLVKKNARIPLNCMRVDNITEDICEDEIRINPLALQHVPNELKSKRLCMQAFASNVDVIEYFPTEYKTYDVCIEAVEKNGLNLEFVPEDIITEKLCFVAVTNEGSAISYIPEKYLTEELCEIAVTNDGSAFSHVPQHCRTYAICKAAIKKSYENIGEITGSSALCDIALAISPYAIQFINDCDMTQEMCDKAVDELPNMLEFIPDRFKTLELCINACKYNSRLLKFCPENIVEKVESESKSFGEKFCDKITTPDMFTSVVLAISAVGMGYVIGTLWGEMVAKGW